MNEKEKIKEIVDKYIEYGGEEEPNYNRVTDVRELINELSELLIPVERELKKQISEILKEVFNEGISKGQGSNPYSWYGELNKVYLNKLVNLFQPQSVSEGDVEQKLIDVEDLLTTFCADVYGYAHKKKEVFGENREYFVTLEELDRVFTKFMESIKTQPTKDSREVQE